MAVTLLASGCLGGCVSLPDYGRARAADFADIFLIEFTAGPGLDVHARATDFFATGLGLAKTDGWTISGRDTGAMHRNSFGMIILSASTGDADPKFEPVFAAQRHLWEVPNSSLLCVIPFHSVSGSGNMLPPGIWRDRWWRVLDLQAGACCVAAVHLGFSPGELVDFVLGWTTIDFPDDDIVSQVREDKPDSSTTVR